MAGWFDEGGATLERPRREAEHRAGSFVRVDVSAGRATYKRLGFTRGSPGSADAPARCSYTARMTVTIDLPGDALERL